MTSDKLGNFLILTEKKNQKQSGTVAISAFSKDFKFINENIFESTSLYDLVGGIDVDQENNILVGLTRVAREYGEPDTSDIMALKLKGFTLPPQIKVPETGEVRIIGGGEEDPLNTLKGDKAVISYRITSSGEVDLIVYNQMGDPVWQNKFDSEDTEGTLEWRGRTKEGVLLPPGSYIMHFRAPGINTTRSIRVIN